MTNTCTSTAEPLMLEKEKHSIDETTTYDKYFKMKLSNTQDREKYRRTSNIQIWSEIRTCKLNSNKEARPGGVIITILAALDDFGIAKIIDIINEYIQQWGYTRRPKYIYFHSTT